MIDFLKDNMQNFVLLTIIVFTVWYSGTGIRDRLISVLIYCGSGVILGLASEKYQLIMLILIVVFLFCKERLMKKIKLIFKKKRCK